MFWIGNNKGMGGILLAEKQVEAVVDVQCVSDKIIFIKLIVEKSIVTVLSISALQAGFDDSMKYLF